MAVSQPTPSSPDRPISGASPLPPWICACLELGAPNVGPPSSSERGQTCGGLPPMAVSRSIPSLPDRPISGASPLPPWICACLELGAPTVGPRARVNAVKPVGGGLPPRAVRRSIPSLPDRPISGASPLPPWICACLELGAPTVGPRARVNAVKPVGRGLPPRAVCRSIPSLPDRPISGASPLPPWICPCLELGAPTVGPPS